METTLVKIDPKEFGIEEQKAAQIAAQFQPVLDLMVEYEKETNEIYALPIEDPKTAARAKQHRLKYVKIRTSTEKIHKEQKSFYLLAGRYIDGWKNAQLFASQGIEEKLQAIENHAEIMEKQRIEALNLERIEQVKQYEVVAPESLGLGNMSEGVFNNYLLGTKAAYEARKAQELAELQAEEERVRMNAIRAERISKLDKVGFLTEELKTIDVATLSEEDFENEYETCKARRAAYEVEQEYIREENERLKLEAEQKEKALEAERQRVAKEQKEAQERADAEKAEIARLAKEESDRQAAVIAKQAKDLQDAKDAETKRLADIEAAKEADAAKGDEAKIADFIAELTALGTKYTFKSAKYKKLYADSGILISKIVNHVNTK